MSHGNKRFYVITRQLQLVYILCRIGTVKYNVNTTARKLHQTKLLGTCPSIVLTVLALDLLTC